MIDANAQREAAHAKMKRPYRLSPCKAVVAWVAFLERAGFLHAPSLHFRCHTKGIIPMEASE
jgi:hypothetical protein